MVHILKKKGKESRVRCYFKELRMWGLLCSRTKTQREFSSAFQTPTSSWYDVPKEVRVWSPIRLIIKWTLLPFCMHMFSVTQSCLTVIPWIVAHQALLSLGFSRQDTEVCYYFLLQGIFTDPGLKSASPASPAFCTTELPRKPVDPLHT